MSESDGDTMKRARRYPFTQPTSSYIFTAYGPIEILDPIGPWEPSTEMRIAGGVTTLREICADAGIDESAASAKRRPVFGYGSNPSPETLTRKYAERPDLAIPVIRVELENFDAVYSSHVFGGFVPATLQSSPGTTLTGFQLYLTDNELDLLHETESLGENYVFAQLYDVEARFGDGSVESELTTYLSTWGCLRLDTDAAALSAVEARNRAFAEHSEIAVLERVHQRVSPSMRLDEFVTGIATDPDEARACSTTLSEDAVQVDAGSWIQIDDPGHAKVANRRDLIRYMFSRPVDRGGHPKNRSRLRGLLSRMGFLELLLLALLLLVGTAVACGALLNWGAPENAPGSFPHWFEQAFLGFGGMAGPELTKNDGDLPWTIGRLLMSLVALLWPALILGAIVFRLFVHNNMFVLRELISVVPKSEGSNEYTLEIRLYNMSPLEPVSVRFEVFLQRFFHHRASGATRENTSLQVDNLDWPLAERHVPYTLRVPLHDGDVVASGDRLQSIQGNRLSSKADLLLYITGDASELGTTTNELHRIPIAESLSFVPHFGVNVNYGGPSRKWKGWSRFDEPRA